jgi:hypothetical protein
MSEIIWDFILLMNSQFHEELNCITAGSKFVSNNKGNSEKWRAMRLEQYVANMRGVEFVYKVLVRYM